MKSINLLLLFVAIICGCNSNTKPKEAVSQPPKQLSPEIAKSDTACRTVLKDFFHEYDSIIRARDINKLVDYIDEDSRRWGMGKPGIVKRVRNNFGVIMKYDVTIKQCKMVNQDTILWEGYADWGVGITQHSMGTGLVRRDGKWRMRVIEFRP